MFNGNSILEWRCHIFGHILGVYHSIFPYIALKHRPKMVRYLGTSNKSVLEIARRMHIAALWLMLTWRACWPSLRRIWRDLAAKMSSKLLDSTIEQKCKSMGIYCERDRWIMMDIYIYIRTIYRHTLCIYIHICVYIG